MESQHYAALFRLRGLRVHPAPLRDGQDSELAARHLQGREVCEEFLLGRYHLQVVDIYQQPALAGSDHIMVTPTLVRKAPGPLRRLIGNLTDRDRILAGLEAAAGRRRL